MKSNILTINKNSKFKEKGIKERNMYILSSFNNDSLKNNMQHLD